MGLFDFLLSPEKQIEKERKLLEKPNHTVAVVTSYRDWDSSEIVTDDEGNTDVRSYKMEESDFKFKIDGEWCEYTTMPREGSYDFREGEQWIVKYSKGSKAIVAMHQKLRDDSPFRIEY